MAEEGPDSEHGEQGVQNKGRTVFGIGLPASVQAAAKSAVDIAHQHSVGSLYLNQPIKSIVGQTLNGTLNLPLYHVAISIRFKRDVALKAVTSTIVAVVALERS